MKFTPGPWTAQPTAAPYQQHAIWDGLGRLIGTTAGCSDGDDRVGSPTTEEADRANAFMFAAAPELLAAARSALLAIHCNRGAVDPAIRQEAEAYLRAAIAKAEGQPVIPIGHIDTIMGDTAPPGWLFCDGKDVRMSDYPELFKLFANAGSTTPTTFRLPRLNMEKVKFPAGERVLRYVIKAEERS